MSKESGATRTKFEKTTDNVAIFQREGKWYANIQWAGKQVRRSLKTESKKQAKLNALKLAGELSKGQSSSRRDKATIEEVFEMFIDWKVNDGLAGSTLAKYRFGIKVAMEVAEKLGRRRLSQIDPRYMDEFRANRKKVYGSGANTIRKDLILIGGIVKFALSRKLLTEDPLAGYKIPKAKSSPQPCWSPEEMEQIIKACDRRPHQDIYAVLADTGMRIGELIHLTWEDIDSVRNVLQIRSKKEWKTKTGNHRAIPMTKRVQRLLALQRRRSKWVFTFEESSRGHIAGRQVSARRLLDYLKVRLKRLGLKGIPLYQHNSR